MAKPLQTRSRLTRRRKNKSTSFWHVKWPHSISGAFAVAVCAVCIYYYVSKFRSSYLQLQLKMMPSETRRSLPLCDYSASNLKSVSDQDFPRMTAAEFQSEYSSKRFCWPVIIFGALDEWPALRKWNKTFFSLTRQVRVLTQEKLNLRHVVLKMRLDANGGYNESLVSLISRLKKEMDSLHKAHAQLQEDYATVCTERDATRNRMKRAERTVLKLNREVEDQRIELESTARTLKKSIRHRAKEYNRSNKGQHDGGDDYYPPPPLPTEEDRLAGTPKRYRRRHRQRETLPVTKSLRKQRAQFTRKESGGLFEYEGEEALSLKANARLRPVPMFPAEDEEDWEENLIGERRNHTFEEGSSDRSTGLESCDLLDSSREKIEQSEKRDGSSMHQKMVESEKADATVDSIDIRSVESKKEDERPKGNENEEPEITVVKKHPKKEPEALEHEVVSSSLTSLMLSPEPQLPNRNHDNSQATLNMESWGKQHHE